MAGQHGRRIAENARLAIIRYWRDGLSVIKIQQLLKSHHNCVVTRPGIYNVLKKWKLGGGIATKKRVGDRKTLLPLHMKFIDLWLSRNNELTTQMLQRKLFETFGVQVSCSLIRKRRRELGWTSVVSKTCQMISNKNKMTEPEVYTIETYFAQQNFVKVRLQGCLDNLVRKEKFEDVIFVDESTVEMSASGRLFFHHEGSKIDKKCARRPKPKHAYKVHVWAGISYRGRTSICVFNGVMDSVTYQGILENNLLPFVRRKFPDGYRLYQDNDSKHVSKSTKQWMMERGMLDRVMKTPASSPDLNPIENVWASLKYHLQTVSKPRTRDQLVEGIHSFWESLTTKQCGRYIDHVFKVMPYVVLNSGEASGF